MFSFRECIGPMKPYVPGRSAEDVKRAYGLERVVKLASNENPRGCSPSVREALAGAFSESALYPDGYCARLRAAVSAFYNVAPERLVFGAGTDEIIAMLGKVFIEPGDESVTAEVTFSQYETAVVSMGGKMTFAPMRDSAYDLDAILERVTPKTKIIWLANPNNPTGTFFTREEQDAFMRRAPRDVAVVFDEAYSEYVTDARYPDTWETLRRYDNAILLKTFSKIYGLASFRVGFGAASPELVTELEKLRCPFNVSTQAQAAALAALDDQAYVSESRALNRREMERLTAALEGLGMYVVPSQANFVFADTRRDGTEVFERLMRKGYIVRPGAAFGMDPFIRITVGTKEQTDGFIEAIRTVCAILEEE